MLEPLRIARWILGSAVYAALTVPLILLIGVRPSAVALALAAAGALHVAYKMRRRGEVLRKALRGSSYVLGAAILLGVLGRSGVIDPLLSKEGHIVPSVQLVIEPAIITRGTLVEFRIASTNPGPTALAACPIWIDGVDHRGVLVYALIPLQGGRRLRVEGTPSGGVVVGDVVETGRIIYADPGNYTSNPLFWDWRSEYSPGDKIVGCVTIGAVERALAVEETVVLSFHVRVPQDTTPGELKQLGAILAYGTPLAAGAREHFVWEAPSSPPYVVGP